MTPPLKKAKATVVVVADNFIAGRFQAPLSGHYGDVVSPVDGTLLGKVALSSSDDVDVAVKAGRAAFANWSGLTVKTRTACMFRFHALLEAHASELAELVSAENGKNLAEAAASVAKGAETVEWACSMPQLCQGRVLNVSRGIECRDVREPLGVVASVVPFNFPIMVPMWTVPIALTAGNCVILKPSEKVPLTMHRVAELLAEAGIPPGVFQMVNGAAAAAEALCDHPDVAALTFVGSSAVAEKVAARCHATHKRVLALGGAKNHLVALPDCDVPTAASDIVASFAGCAGQRCMAASVLLTVGDCSALVEQVVGKARALQPGVAAGQVGAVIDAASRAKILRYINEAEAGGAEILLDGRPWASKAPGYWVGPTVLRHKSAAEPAVKDEIFGPVMSIVAVSSWDEALEIENGNPYGNAASIYTTVGSHAEYFSQRFRAAMIGVNIGIPVPREPFSFGGLYGTRSKYGDVGDVTGDGCLEFFTTRRKITSKWPAPAAAAATGVTSSNGNRGAAGGSGSGAADKASFVGNM